MVTANEKLIMDAFRAVEKRDVPRLLEIYDPEVEFVWPPSLPGYGGTYQGAAVLDMQIAFANAWDPVQQVDELRRLNPRIIASKDEEVVLLYHQRGKRIDDGRSCDCEVLGLYRVVGGKVVRLQMFYFDPVQVTNFLSSATEANG